ncbi:hypothetical protein [Paracoccus suum]|uniref:hypothetical protein n=1 Tax=Paracoccus suum TaxID=2259340 RepID=UPI0013B05C65|nr:hypothetical protein [Paracoccus suum]
MTEPERGALAKILTRKACPTCHGGRLKAEVLACQIEGRNIADCGAMEPGDLIAFLREIDAQEAVSVIDTLIDRLQALIDLGLDYLTLDRETPSLSGGESQRIKMVRYLGSSLSDIAYIFDEPSTGLHPRDVHQVTELMNRLRGRGNSVLIVEHDPDVVAIADEVIDVGPGAGPDGGQIVFQGTLDELRRSETRTAKAFTQPRSLRAKIREPKGQLQIRNASLHNLHEVSADMPLGVLAVIVGVAGSGKSTLTNSILARRYPEIVCIDQSALGGISPFDTRDLHRHSGPYPRPVCQSQRRSRRPVQQQLCGSMPGLSRPRSHPHRFGVHGYR